MPAAKQLKLISGTWAKDKFAFGGALLKNSHAKKKRPFVPKLPLHVVLKSSAARGQRSLLAHNSAVTKALEEKSRKHGVQVLQAANGGNHLHLVIEAPSRPRLIAFLKALSSHIAMIVTRARKTQPSKEKFWDARPFSRVVNRGKDLLTLSRYVAMNSTESATGFSRDQAREMFRQIQSALKSGLLPRSASLAATGFV